jgi:hypothetical protein
VGALPPVERSLKEHDRAAIRQTYLYKSTLGGGGFRLGDEVVASVLAIAALASWYFFMLVTPVALLFDSMATTADTQAHIRTHKERNQGCTHAVGVLPVGRYDHRRRSHRHVPEPRLPDGTATPSLLLSSSSLPDICWLLNRCESCETAELFARRDSNSRALLLAPPLLVAPAFATYAAAMALVALTATGFVHVVSSVSTFQ